MGSAQSRENGVTRLGLDELSKLVGRRCSAWLNARKDRDQITLVGTRNYIPLKTALYAQWLLFQNEATYREFVQAFPRYSLDIRLTELGQERAALAANLDHRLQRGDFDLSRIGTEQQRTNLALRYVELTEKLRQLHEDFRLLETVKVLSVKWQESFDQGPPS
jgi:hypothetical protein